MVSFEELVQQRYKVVTEIRQLKHEQEDIEEKVMQYLIKENMFDMFSVNWRKIYGLMMRK